MNGKWIIVALCALLIGAPVFGQSGPALCDAALIDQYRAWDATFTDLLNALPQSMADARDRLTAHLETGMEFGLSDCDAARAGYFERVARVYAIMTWTTTAALSGQDSGAGGYLGDLTDKAARMTDFIRNLPPRSLEGGAQ